jgi:hypothetical protein
VLNLRHVFHPRFYSAARPAECTTPSSLALSLSLAS